MTEKVKVLIVGMVFILSVAAIVGLQILWMRWTR
jgi:hypothetical protein